MQEVHIKKEEYFKLLSENIILKDIYVKNKLKNYDLLIYIINFLAQESKLISAREMHKILNENWIKVSHITLIEYLGYILNSNLVEKIYRHDLKLKNTSTWKAKYLFFSTDIRKSILNNNVSKSTINENIIYETLIKLNKSSVFTWKNGTFYFSFLVKDIVIHVSKNMEKNEIKKEAKKLLKIPWEFKKYLIVNNVKEIWIRPSTYLPLEILEIEEFLEKFK